MKERPILFSGPMVRAILDGRKTQTRRICKHQPTTIKGPNYDGLWSFTTDPVTTYFACPHGQPGDRLYVREEYYQFGHWESVPGVKTKQGRMKWKFVPDSKEIVFTPAHEHFRKGRHHKDPETKAWHKRLGRFMPKAASRITLKIESIRVERLNEISPDDAQAEGLAEISKDGKLYKYGIPDRDGLPGTDDFGWPWHEWRISPVDAYQRIWESINGKGNWAANPWVWVITFRKL